MIEKYEIIEMMVNSQVFKWTIGTVITTLTGFAIASVRKTNRMIREAATKEDLHNVKNEAFKYTDARMKIHEDLQVLEIASMKREISETHKMVSVIYETAVKKNS